jgi:hypothetical protein
MIQQREHSFQGCLAKIVMERPSSNRILNRTGQVTDFFQEENLMRTLEKLLKPMRQAILPSNGNLPKFQIQVRENRTSGKL